MSVLSIFTAGVGVGAGEEVVSFSIAGEGACDSDSLPPPHAEMRETIKNKATIDFRIGHFGMLYSFVLS